jgi:prepilin-type N-terminal cleavage/methylation domain-containing protein
MKRKKISFTLLEVMVAIALLAITSSVIGWNMFAAARKKEFHSQVERFEVKLQSAKKLAVAMESDWRGRLIREPDGKWALELVCNEGAGNRLSTLHLAPMKIYLDRKPIEKSLDIDLFSSGKILPEGVLTFSYRDETREVSLRK